MIYGDLLDYQPNVVITSEVDSKLNMPDSSRIDNVVRVSALRASAVSKVENWTFVAFCPTCHDTSGVIYTRVELG